MPKQIPDSLKSNGCKIYRLGKLFASLQKNARTESSDVI